MNRGYQPRTPEGSSKGCGAAFGPVGKAAPKALRWRLNYRVVSFSHAKGYAFGVSHGPVEADDTVANASTD
jgi:hypothetical protein